MIMSQLKFSDYNIIVKCKNREGYNIVHGYRGSYMHLDDNIGIKFVNRDETLFSENPNILEPLIKSGFLCTQDTDELSMLKRVSDLMHKKGQEKYKVTLLPTYSCNFRCPYCFENKNFTREQKCDEKHVMSSKMVDDIFKMIENHDHFKQKTIHLFGGEPLKRDNKDIVSYIVKEGSKHGVSFIATTNGYDLEFFSDVLSQQGINTIQITLDGSGELHNRTRHLHNGMPTFEKIVKNIDTYVKKGISIIVRTNISSTNLDEVKKLISFYKEKGWLRYKNFAYYFSPICKDNVDEYVDNLDHIKLLEYMEEAKITDDVPLCHVAGYRNIYLRLKSLIENKRMVLFGSEMCSACNNGIMVDPDGMVYTCDEMLGTEYVCGQIVDGKLNTNKSFDKWNDRYVSNMECCKCAYALFCGGGCPVELFRNNQDIYTLNCGKYKLFYNECLANI